MKAIVAQVLVGGAVAIVAAGACAVRITPSAAAQPAPTSASPPPPGQGRDLIYAHCAVCHGTGQIFMQHQTRADWAATVQTMVDRGAQLSPAERATVIAYLARNYPAAGVRGPR